MTVELKELEYAVCDVIQIVKQIPELAESRLAVIGGLALWHYLPGHRPTDVSVRTDTEPTFSPTLSPTFRGFFFLLQIRFRE